MNEGIVLKFYVSYLYSTVHFCKNFRKKKIRWSLKGKANELFNLQFFHHLNQPGPLATGHRVKIFSNLVSYWNISGYITALSFTPQSIILRGVHFFDTKFRITQQNLHKKRKYFIHWSVAQAGLNYDCL